MTASAVVFLDDGALLERAPGLPDAARDGAREMLRALHAAAWPVAVVTARAPTDWESAAARLQLDAPVTIVTAGEADAAGEALARAAAALGAAPAEVVVVAAGTAALRAARAAGMEAGAALWAAPGPEERTALRAEAAGGSHRVFERPADVTRALAAWC